MEKGSPWAVAVFGGGVGDSIFEGAGAGFEGFAGGTGVEGPGEKVLVGVSGCGGHCDCGMGFSVDVLMCFVPGALDFMLMR